MPKKPQLQAEQLTRSLSYRSERGAAFNASKDTKGSWSTQPHGAGSGKGAGKGKGRGQRDGAKDYSQLKCHYCGKKGHIKRDCRRKKREESAPGAEGSSLMAASSFAAVASELAAISAEAGTHSAARVAASKTSGHKYSDEWILDSGASSHMTHDKSALQDFRSLKIASRITFGNGDQGMAEGKGDIVLHTPCGKATLRDVLYVPTLVTNLLSVSTAMDRGTDVKFDSIKHTVTLLQRGRAVLTATRRDNLFIVNRDKPAAHTALVATKESAAAQLWHRRFGHLSYDSLAKMARGSMVRGMDISPAAFLDAKQRVCEPCVLAKQQRKPFFASQSTATEPLECVHTDICGPITPATIKGERYFATFSDEATTLSITHLLKRKSDMESVLPKVLRLLETQIGKKVKAIRSDRGGEYISAATERYLAGRGIIHQRTAPYTPEQNGQAERMNRTLVERARAAILDHGLPRNLWGESVQAANYVRNRSIAARIPAGTPWKSAFNVQPDVSHLRVFGCIAYVHRPRQRRKKLDNKAQKGIFVGYATDSKAYRVLVDGKIIESRDVTFDEAAEAPSSSNSHADAGEPPMPGLISDSDSEDDADDNGDEDSNDDHFWGPPQPAHSGQLSASSSEDEDDTAPDPGESQQSATRPQRTRTAPDFYRPDSCHAATIIQLDDEPRSAKEALSGPQAQQWRQAMDEEMKSLAENHCWELEELPSTAKAIGCKWIFKIKRDAKGNIERYKARLVAKGFTQREHIDFEEVYAPVSQYATLRALLSTVADRDLELRQLDIKTAFLNGDLEEELYMNQPPGYETGGRRTVCRLRRALYGLRQAGRAWHVKLKKALQDLGFTASDADASLFTQHSGGDLIIVLVYVDDILIAARDLTAIQGVTGQLLTIFQGRDMGEPALFLGMQIQRDRAQRTLQLSQERYALSVCERFGMEGSRTKTIPLTPGLQLQREGDAMSVDECLYGELIGCLLYLASCTRPDIAQAVGTLARFMSAPKQQHWLAAKGILRYISCTSARGITFRGAKALAIFCDADFAGDMDTRRSRTGFVGTLNGGAIVWNSKLQPTVAASTCEAEYMALAAACKEALWLRKLLPDLGIAAHHGPITIQGDNVGALMVARNPISTPRSKHIDVLHHFARERAQRKEVCFEYISTAENMADVMTKALPERKFKLCLDGMGLSD